MTTIQVSCLDNPTKMNAHFSHLIKKKKKNPQAECKVPCGRAACLRSPNQRRSR